MARSKLHSLFPVFLLLLAACSSRQPPAPLDACARVDLDPSPVWTASAAWNPAETRLLLVDPRTESLVAYDRSGAARERVALGALVEFDYSVPIRLHSHAGGYTLGDRKRVLWLGPQFEKRRLVEPFARLEKANGTSGTLGDFVYVARRGGQLYAFADVVTGDDEWRRGFERLSLDAPELETLFSPPKEDSDELDRYYLFDRRPYLAVLGRAVYALRYSEPAEILRAAPRANSPRFEKLAKIELAEGFEAWALYAFDGRLWVLGSRLEEEKQEISPAGIEAPADQLARLQAAERLHRSQRTWELQEIDPATGEAGARFALPTTAQRLQIVPGRTAWALIEETTAPNLESEGTGLVLLPARAFDAAGGGGTIELACGQGI